MVPLTSSPPMPPCHPALATLPCSRFFQNLCTCIQLKCLPSLLPGPMQFIPALPLSTCRSSSQRISTKFSSQHSNLLPTHTPISFPNLIFLQSTHHHRTYYVFTFCLCVLEYNLQEGRGVHLFSAVALMLPDSAWDTVGGLPVCCESVSHSVVTDSLRPHGLSRLLCPWGFPGKNTGVSSHSLLQGIFPTQGSNLGLLLCRFFSI